MREQVKHLTFERDALKAKLDESMEAVEFSADESRAELAHVKAEMEHAAVQFERERLNLLAQINMLKSETALLQAQQPDSQHLTELVDQLEQRVHEVQGKARNTEEKYEAEIAELEICFADRSCFVG